MKRTFAYILLSLISAISFADDLSIFQGYAQKADSAFRVGDKKLCFSTNRVIIDKYSANKKKYSKSDEICVIAFEAYSSIAILDKTLNEENACELLAKALSIIDLNSNWVKAYTNKNHIVMLYTKLIGGYSKLGKIESACKYNQGMISFAEKFYQFEIVDVLMTACALYSGMHEFDRNDPIYQRLYNDMFDELDRIQQYKVVRELIHFEFKKENYANVALLSFKHEKLISKAKDEIKDVLYDIIGLGLLRNAKRIANDAGNEFSSDVDKSFLSACQWAQKNYQTIYPTICIEYAYWLYGLDKTKSNKAIEQYELYLIHIENLTSKQLFDNKYRYVEDAENAIISILVQKIFNAAVPEDINSILNKFPRIVAAIKNAPQSELYEDFINALNYAEEICYGKK